MSDLCVFTSGYTDPPIDASLLEESCKRVGIELQAYGVGERWPGFCVGKIREARRFLTTRSEEYALFTDSSDSFIVSPERVILDSFRAFGTSVLVSGEKNCYPLPGDATRYPQTGAIDDTGMPWRFINSGGWIGYRVRLVEVLGELDNVFVSLAKQGGRRSDDDQSCWTEWILCHHRESIYSYVDAHCKIFQTMWRTTEMREDGTNSVTNTKPAIWHFNGIRNDMRNWYGRLLGVAQPAGISLAESRSEV